MNAPTLKTLIYLAIIIILIAKQMKRDERSYTQTTHLPSEANEK